MRKLITWLISWLFKWFLTPIYKTFEYALAERVKRGIKPKHVGIIMDGNRRFATTLGLLPWDGHEVGANKLEEVLNWCLDLNINIITVYAFSRENFNRSTPEVQKLMELFEKKFLRLVSDERVHKNKIRVRTIGRVDLLPENVQKAIRTAEVATTDYKNHFLNVAIGYSGREEIVEAFRKVAEKVQRGELSKDKIDETVVHEHLYTAGLPDPDLIIRTSGEERLSGFLLWQSSYSELYFCESYWPAFRKIDFLRALREFQNRQRRYGK